MGYLISLSTLFLLIVLSWAETAPAASSARLTSESLKLATQEGPICAYLKNAHFKEYLYTTSSVIDSTKRVRVFTWMNKSDGSAREWKDTWGEKYDNQGLWLIEKHHACLDCYTIKSLYEKDMRHQYLFSVANTDPEFRNSRPRRSVYAYRIEHAFPESEGEHIWKIEDVDGKSHVRIQSKTIGRPMGEYLYAVGNGETFDAERRSIFTWASKQDSEAFTEQGDWILKKTDCPTVAE